MPDNRSRVLTNKVEHFANRQLENAKTMLKLGDMEGFKHYMASYHKWIAIAKKRREK